MTPEQEEQVRRALADAASERTPLPPDVADRLDDVLADLVAGQRESTQGAGATEEHGARRWPLVLVAAAVVCLIALGGPAVMRAVTPDDRGDRGADSSAGAAATADEGSGSAGETASAAPTAPSAGKSRAFAQRVLPPPRLHRATLQRDVRRVLAAVPVQVPGPSGLAERPNSTTGCRMPPRGRDADVVAVLLDGKPATLVLAAPRKGTRQALVYSCEDVSAPLAATRVPGP